MSPAPQGRNRCLSEAIWEKDFYLEQFGRGISGVASAMETISRWWKPPQRCATALGGPDASSPGAGCRCCSGSLPSRSLPPTETGSPFLLPPRAGRGRAGVGDKPTVLIVSIPLWILAGKRWVGWRV